LPGVFSVRYASFGETHKQTGALFGGYAQGDMQFGRQIVQFAQTGPVDGKTVLHCLYQLFYDHKTSEEELA
jgi:hypothetical protein